VSDVRLPALVGACAVGGALGSLARWAVAEAWPGEPTTWPWATFTVNVVGCLLLGLLLGSPLGQDPMRRAFLGAGVLGGFTTFSTYALQVKVVTDDGHGGTAALYAAASVVACLVAAHVGRRLAERRDDLGPADEQADA
jgi:fluoride exporter